VGARERAGRGGEKARERGIVGEESGGGVREEEENLPDSSRKSLALKMGAPQKPNARCKKRSRNTIEESE
jgi:hypothetical protein